MKETQNKAAMSQRVWAYLSCVSLINIGSSVSSGKSLRFFLLLFSFESYLFLKFYLGHIVVGME